MSTSRHVLGTLVTTVKLEEERRLREQCQSLLKVAKKLFSHLGNKKCDFFYSFVFLTKIISLKKKKKCLKGCITRRHRKQHFGRQP